MTLRARILYILGLRNLTPRRWPWGGLPWDGEPSESAALVMPSVVTAARAAGDQRQLLLPVDADYSCRSWGETVWDMRNRSTATLLPYLRMSQLRGAPVLEVSTRRRTRRCPE